MKVAAYKVLVWVPRILCILFIGFIGMFSLDVFSKDRELGEMLVHFLIHNIPVYILIACLALAWWRAWLGGVLFSVLGIAYIILQWGERPFLTYVIISGPSFLLALLFLLGWLARRVRLCGRS